MENAVEPELMRDSGQPDFFELTKGRLNNGAGLPQDRKEAYLLHSSEIFKYFNYHC